MFPNITMANWRRLFACGACCLFTASSIAQRIQLNPATAAKVIDSLSLALNANYIFPDTAVRMENSIKERLKNHAYAALADPGEFAKALTADVRAVYRDVHLWVQFNPDLEKEMQTHSYLQMAVRSARLSKQAQQQNYGFEKVEVLSGNLGYIALNSFFEAGEQSKAAADAAFNFLKNTNGLIIDLRLNGGGATDMVAYLCSYFFKERTHINDMYERRANQNHEYRTDPLPASATFSDMPIYILVSRYTVSAAEEFAYDLQSLHRAVVIGKTTGGGAHPTQAFYIGNGFIAYIPFARAINPVTKKNWESVGVKPDISAEDSGALDTAISVFYTHRAAESKDTGIVKSFRWLQYIHQAKTHPVKLKESELKSLSGDYDGITISFEKGGLFYNSNGYVTAITPASTGSFTMETPLDNRRLDFHKNAAGQADELTLSFNGAVTEKHKRGKKSF